MKKIILRILKSTSVGKYLVTLHFLSKYYLKENGWKLSIKRGLPVDKEGQELPWFTYSSIQFLTSRLNKELSVFEYGSGNSTIWFSNKMKKVVSVEHNKEWYSQLKNKLKEKPNIKYILKDLNSGEYQNEILNYEKTFDIIVIDGRNRVQCSMNSLSALKENGVIIWDNSNRTRYSEGHNFLISNGFKRIDFWGIGPINFYSWCTSIFYKENNCLDI
jgi:hypothetical protein